MSWSMIERGRLYCIYGNHLRSIQRLNVTIKCFKSSDNEDKGSKRGSSEGVNKQPLQDRKKFWYFISGNVETETEKKFVKTQQFKGDHKIKLKNLLNNFEGGIPGRDLKVDVTVKPKKQPTKRVATESEKQGFLRLAKQVAESLKIDVTKTQEELYDQFSKIGATREYIGICEENNEAATRQRYGLEQEVGAIQLKAIKPFALLELNPEEEHLLFIHEKEINIS